MHGVAIPPHASYRKYKMKNRTPLFILITLCVVLLFFLLWNCKPSHSAETKLPEFPTNVELLFSLDTPVRFESLADMPHDFAKYLPDETWYWWAKMHNAKQYGNLPAYRNVIQIEGDDYYSSSSTSPDFSPSSSDQLRSRTTIYNFTEPIPRGPVTIYNPYFR